MRLRRAPRRSSTASAPPARSGSARPTWPATGPTDDLRRRARRVRRATCATSSRRRCTGCGTPCCSRQPADARQHRSRAPAQNIHQHYDLSNELFTTFLDESMTYSSALFDGEPDGAGDDLADRAAPQDRPAARRAGRRRRHPAARDRHRLGRARDPRGAARGAEVTSLTISTEQAELARERIAAAGLADRATRAAAGLPRGRAASTTPSSASR